MFGTSVNLKKTEKFNKVRYTPDYSTEQMLQAKTVQQMHTLARSTEGVESQMRGTQIKVNGKLYKPAEFKNIKPKEISPYLASTKKFAWGTAFQGHNAPLSNFYPCNIKGKNEDDELYSSVEQYYCILMARDHGNLNLAKLMKHTSNPFHLKAMSGQVIKSKRWMDKAEQVLEDIVLAKFTQNPDLRPDLLGCKGIFAECTKCPTWGCGRYMQDAHLAQNPLPTHKNIMGKILKKVQQKIAILD